MLTAVQRLQLAEGASVWGLPLNEETLDRFAKYAELLEEGNRRLNLTRIAPEDVVTLHFLDSLALAAIIKPEPGTRLLDVGTGAGFPGVPLALAFPGLDVTLLDGTRKRLDFLDQVLAELHLSRVRTLHGRAEEIVRQPAHRRKYDVVVARAVAKMPVLATWLLPLVRPGGSAVAYKSRAVEEEMAAALPEIKKAGGTAERIVDVPLPGTDIIRKLIVMAPLSGPERKSKP